MKLWLEIDGERHGEARDFAIDKTTGSRGWGPAYAHQRKGQLCTFEVDGIPPNSASWGTSLVDESGMAVHELTIQKVEISIEPGKAVSKVTAELM